MDAGPSTSTAAPQIGDFLRTRRAAVRPEHVGMARGTRRVPGLRREEVAWLAGVSADYYTRLEQGVERHPSPQVVTSLARALDLSGSELAHLESLAQLPSTAPIETSTAVDPSVLHLIDQWPGHPAFVINDAMDILAANALGHALHAAFGTPDNLARMVFVQPEGRGFYVEWEDIAQLTTSNLRAAWGRRRGSGRIDELIEELRERSAEFATRWARHEVTAKADGTKLVDHPWVGRIRLQFRTLSIAGTASHHIVVYFADPGGPDQHLLEQLVALAEPVSPNTVQDHSHR